MAKIIIRVQAGFSSPDDIAATVQDTTYEYLLTSQSPKIRISAYLDKDWPMIQKTYAEVFVSDDCAFKSKIEQMTPGSKQRQGISLPGPMKIGEQLTLLVTRSAMVPESE